MIQEILETQARYGNLIVKGDWKIAIGNGRDGMEATWIGTEK